MISSEGHSSWIEKASSQLKAIEQLPFGWDAQGADPPRPRLVAAARNLLAQLAAARSKLATPHIHPTRSGGVQFHWESGPRYFEIEVVEANLAEYYFVDRDLKREIEGSFHPDHAGDDILDFIATVENGL